MNLNSELNIELHYSKFATGRELFGIGIAENMHMVEHIAYSLFGLSRLRGTVIASINFFMNGKI